jgi:type IV secretory pathway VirB9-like protein
MTTTIALPAWERIKAYELGDEGTYKVKRINPTLLNVKTNGLIGTDTTLTVYGESGQIYAFYMRSEGYNSKNISDVIVHVQAPSSLIKEGLEFHQKVSSDANSPEGDFLEAVSSDPGDLDFNYSMAGDAEIAPDRIYTDGKKTWFDYGSRIKKADLPAVFNVVDGIDTPVNVIREGGKLVAFGTGTFSLKHGKRVTCVYPTDSNKA